MALKIHRRSDDFTFIPNALIMNENISPQAKLVYMSVANRRQHGEPDPTPEVIAAETSLNVTAVEIAEKELNDLPDAEWERMQL